MPGQIIKRGNGTWLVRVFLGRDRETGKREYHNKTIHGNKKDAGEALTDLLKDKSAGRLTIGAQSHVIGDLLDDVVRDYRINGQDVTWAGLVIDHLRPTFGRMPRSAIRPRHVDAYIEQRRRAGRANATINHELSMLRRAFNLAREKGTITAAPFLIPKLEENNVRKGFFEYSEYSALRGSLPAELRPVLTFAYYTGCRKGEILGLQWSQVDLIRRIVRLEAGETKNSEPRILPLMVDELYETLAMLRAERDRKFPECPWVFARRGRRILHFRKAWDTACEAVGLWDAARKRPARIFHDLRRTGVRNLIRAGVPEKVAMLISGHKTRSVFERYNIVDERDVIEAMGKLNAYSQDRQRAEKKAQRKAKTAAAGNWHTIGTQTSKRPN